MTEEVVVPQIEEEQKPELTSEQVVPELTPVEQEATSQGWKPKEQWEGDPEEWVSAGEFKRRGELFKKISDTNRRLDKATAALTALQSHQRQVYQAGYDAALTQLRADHKVAVEAGDVNLADKIVDKIEQTKQAAVVAAQTTSAPPEPPAVLGEFMDKNQAWYQKDDVMTAYADRVGHDFARAELQAGRKTDFAEVLAHVEKKVREKFPSSFGAKARVAPSVVDGGSPNRQPFGARKSNFGENDLSDDERRVMKSFADSGVMTKEEYISDIKKIRGIK